MPEFAPLFDVKTPASLPPETARPAAESGKPLRLGGLTPLTTIDFPGRLAAVLYCQGCSWRCTYCHNTELLDAATPPALPWPDALAFLHRRRGLLDGVVFSGGEPTLQAALADALAAVRALGMQTALHTAGMYPQRLAAPPLLPPGRSRQSKSASLARALSALPCGAPEKRVRPQECACACRLSAKTQLLEPLLSGRPRQGRRNTIRQFCMSQNARRVQFRRVAQVKPFGTQGFKQ